MLIEPNKLTSSSTLPVQGNAVAVVPGKHAPSHTGQADVVSDTRAAGAVADTREQSSSPFSSQEDLKKAISEAKEYIQSYRRDLSLDYDDESGRLVIKVIDRDTEEVVRQIPPEEILDFFRSMKKLGDGLEGVFLSEKA